jgi:hypothetical protein
VISLKHIRPWRRGALASLVVLASLCVADPSVAAPGQSARPIDPAVVEQIAIERRSVWPATDADARPSRQDRRVAEGWFCPIGTCGPPPSGSAVRGAISFGAATLVAGLIARRRSGRAA